MGKPYTKPEQKERWNKYNNEYSRKNYKTITIKLNRIHDSEVISFLTNRAHGTTTEIIRNLVKEKLGK